MNEPTEVTKNFPDELFFSDVVENLPGALFHYWLCPDGTDRIHFVNNGCFEIWEVPTEEAERDTNVIWSLLVEEDVPGMQASIEKSAENFSNWFHKWRIVTPSGKLKWLQGFAKARPTPDGGVYWNSVILDITAEVKAEQAIHKSYTETVETLCAALEARDPYTAGHSQSVSEIAQKIALELNLPNQQIEGLILGAMVHDIGKIQIPSSILTKPTKLSENEMKLIQEHPIVGANLLKKTNFIWPIHDMILQHHERCDGSGYPYGLKGHEIILEAKILGVADTIESMATNRPYRFAPGLTAALEVIQDGAGTVFDKKVVDAALKVFEDHDEIE